MATALSWGTGISLIGPQGQPGVSVLTGSGSPSSSNTSGVSGQPYIDTVNGVLYQYSNGAWNSGQSLKGPMGINGVSGAFFTGSGAPTSATNSSNASANAIYIQTTGEVWTYTQAGGWIDSGETLVGPQGGRGAMITSGNAVPTTSSPTGSIINDRYIVHGTGELYSFDGNKWNDLGVSLQGPIGLTGQRGSITTSGTAIPTTSAPANSIANDRYVVQTTGEVYSFDGSKWNDLGYSIIGPQGIRGTVTTSGSALPTTSAPANSLAGDRYVVTTSGEVYSFDGSKWNDLGYSIIGPQGVPGLRGTQSCSGTAAPTSSNPANAQAGDFYFQTNSAGTAIQLYQLTGS